MTTRVIIRDDNDITYSMSIYYNPNTCRWVLSFTSLTHARVRDGREQEVEHEQYSEIRRRFLLNCRYYGLQVSPSDVPASEEQFFALRTGTLFPRSVIQEV